MLKQYNLEYNFYVYSTVHKFKIKKKISRVIHLFRCYILFSLCLKQNKVQNIEMELHLFCNLNLTTLLLDYILLYIVIELDRNQDYSAFFVNTSKCRPVHDSYSFFYYFLTYFIIS